MWKGGSGYEVDAKCGCGVGGSAQVEGVWSVGSVCGVAVGLWSGGAAWSMKNGDAEKRSAGGVKEVEEVSSEDHGSGVGAQAMEWMYRIGMEWKGVMDAAWRRDSDAEEDKRTSRLSINY